MGFLLGAGKIATGFGGWLLRNPWVIAIAMLSTAFVLVVVSKNSEIKTLERESNGKDARINSMTAALTTSRNNVATLNKTLQDQSTSILALKTQGDASIEKFDTLIAGQASINANTSRKIASLDMAKPGADKCKSAFDLVRSTVQ
jgi:hypothetical protein